MVFENIDFGVGASTSDAESGLARVRRGLSRTGREADSTETDVSRLSRAFGTATAGAASLATGLGRVEENAEDAEDEVSDLNRALRRTTVASAGLQAASASQTSTLKGMKVAIIGLVGTLVLLATTLFPIVAALGAMATAAVAVAGAFTAVIGTGALAYGEQLSDSYQDQARQIDQNIARLERLEDAQGSLTDQQQQRLEQLEAEQERLENTEGAMGSLATRLGEIARQLKPVIAEFGEQFAPLIRDMIDAIPEFAARILASLGDLDSFRESLRGFGRVAMRAIPAFTGVMADLARVALPVVEDFFNWLLENGGDFLDDMLKALADIAPEMSAFIDALMRLTPTLIEFGGVVSNVLVPVITGLINGLNNLLQWFMRLSPGVQGLTLKALALAGAIPLVVTGLASISKVVIPLAKYGVPLLTKAVGALGLGLSILTGGLAVFAVAWVTNFAGIRDTTNRVAADIGRSLNRIGIGLDSTKKKAKDQMGWWQKYQIRIAAGFDVIGTSIAQVVDDIVTVGKVVAEQMRMMGRLTAAASQGDWTAVRSIADGMGATMEHRMEQFQERRDERFAALEQRNQDRLGAILQNDTSLLPGNQGGGGGVEREKPPWLQEMLAAESENSEKLAELLADLKAEAEKYRKKQDDLLDQQTFEDSLFGDPTASTCDLTEGLLDPYERATQQSAQTRGQMAKAATAAATPSAPTVETRGAGQNTSEEDVKAVEQFKQALREESGGETVIEVDGERFAAVSERMDDLYSRSRFITE